MLEMLRRRLNKDEQGFTLIELMVVVLIIAILLAIAIPSFLGARGKAQDRAAQSNARNALTAEKTFYTDNQKYTDVAADMKAIEPSLGYVAAPRQGEKEVKLVKAATAAGAVVADAVVCITSVSANGTTFIVKDVAAGTNAGTYFTKDAAAGCDDTVGGSWSDKW